MAEKKFYHDIDLVSVGQLLNGRLQNVADQTEEDALAAGLGAAHEGLVIFRTDSDTIKIWSGSSFDGASGRVPGDMILKGDYDASLPLDDVGQPQVIQQSYGDLYVVTTGGTFDPGASGVTLTGNQTLAAQDILLFTGPSQAIVFGSVPMVATETDVGLIRTATQQEVNDGSAGGDVAAVTPETLSSILAGHPVVYTTTLSLTGGNTPDTVQHNLNLASADAFIINAMQGGSQISLDVDSVDANSITLTSLVALTGVTVTITGVPA